MSARKTIIPEWAPESLPAAIPVFLRKKGRYRNVLVRPEQRHLGRIAWITLKNPNNPKCKGQRLSYYWNVEKKEWTMVRSGPRPAMAVHLDYAFESEFLAM